MEGEPLYREWLIPADELNARILTIRKVTQREAVEVSGLPVYSMLEYQRLYADEWTRRATSLHRRSKRSRDW